MPQKSQAGKFAPAILMIGSHPAHATTSTSPGSDKLASLRIAGSIGNSAQAYLLFQFIHTDDSPRLSLDNEGISQSAARSVISRGRTSPVSLSGCGAELRCTQSCISPFVVESPKHWERL